MKKIKYIVLLFILIITGCSTEENNIQKEIQMEDEKPIAEIVDADYVLQSIDNSDIEILDVRTKKEFDEGHIKSALNADWYKSLEENNELKNEEELRKLFGEIDSSKETILYCKSGRRAGLVAEILINKLGYDAEKIKVYKGSIKDWKEKNLEVVVE